jgi:2-polyprenyl-3-methyl-5-hydroxy-6-metoxy-1,4-benzoquinol methylase
MNAFDPQPSVERTDPADRYKTDSVAQNYDQRRFGSIDGRIFNWLERRLIRKVFRDMPRGAMIGDVPCGTGRLAEVLLDSGLRVTGVDISPAMLGIAQARLARFGSQFKPIVADIADLEQSGAKFEAVLSARFLVHFPLAKQIELLLRMGNLSRGTVVFTQAIDTRFHRIRLRVTSHLRSRSSATYPLTPAQIAALMEQAGLHGIRRYRVIPIISQAVVFVTVPVDANSLFR